MLEYKEEEGVFFFSFPCCHAMGNWKPKSILGGILWFLVGLTALAIDLALCIIGLIGGIILLIMISGKDG